jgi:hypothetical protein
VLDSRAFAEADYRLDWLVRWLMVRGQPVLLGGPRKSLKTSIVIDLVVSLAAARLFLGVDAFRVPLPVRVCLLSGESGEAVLQETARRVCAAKGVSLPDLPISWGFDLPQLANAADVATLTQGLKELKIEVLVIDPAYLCLLAGVEGKEINAANLFQVGPLLLSLSRACLAVGCTLVLIHHTRKNVHDPFAPVELEDLAFAGSQEFARQWILVNRREKYEPGSGVHRLWLNSGGCAGQGGQWAVDICEGVLREDFTGRRWEVTVRKAEEARQACADERQGRRDRDDDARLLNALDRLAAQKGGPHAGVGYTEARDLAGLSGAKMTRAVLRLEADGIIEQVELVVGVGKGNKAPKAVKGLRRRPKEGALSD